MKKFKIVKYEIISEKLKQQGFRAAVISDLHNLEFGQKNERLPKIAKMKKIIFDELAKYEDITIFSGEGEDFAPNILTFGIKGVRGEVVVHAFEEHQIYIWSKPL